MTRLCYIVTIEDGANFQQRMMRRVFLNETRGLHWGKNMREDFQAKRRAEGETDEAFISAIEYHITTADLDDFAQ